MKKIDNAFNAKIIFLKNFKIVFKAFLTLGIFVAFMLSFLSDDYLAGFVNITSFFCAFFFNTLYCNLYLLFF
ncbi:hypothetical protein O3K24_000299 [Campylobacter jejuni]|nr:hypothetical protein [Campylobacter jejuni]MCW1375572.1 hypothetical protein [Campylobacter jejuni]